ncbi:hypothetical protein AB9K41_12475, partial [Cribrihabitans sp. XS_ASV171]
MSLSETPPGTPVMRRDGITYHLRIAGSEDQERFRDWMRSEVGRRTIAGFAPVEGAPFSTDFETAEAEEIPDFEGNATRGAALSLALCGRCHVVGEKNRMNGLGSTPSFSVLRTLPDWADRFQIFYVLAPHPSFTQIEGVTAPFDPARPSPIVPM